MKKLIFLALVAVFSYAKDVYIVHGFKSSSQYAWIPSVARELEARGYEVKALDLPHADEPKLEEWLAALRAEVKADEESYFITHSLGGISLLHYLSQADVKGRVGGVLLVAPFDEKLAILPVLDAFSAQKPDYAKLRKLIAKSVVLTAKDDKIVPHELSVKVAEGLGARLIAWEKGGHFMDVDGFYELPVVVEELDRMAR